MNHKLPPKYLLSFFRWFCHPDYVEDIEGDLLERFDRDPSSWRFALEVVRLLRPSLIRPFSGIQKLNYYGMFRHNLIIAFRGFAKHKVVFGINLLGLVMSVTCILFSALWLHDEMLKDRFHTNSDWMFQVYSRFNYESGIAVWRGVTGMLEPEIAQQVPQVEQATVFTDVHEYTLSVNNERFKAEGRFGDEDYFDVFDYPLWKGDKQALADPSAIVVSRSLAKRLFGKEEVVGEMVTGHFFDKEKTFRVGGIIEDVTAQTSEPFSFVLPWAYYHDELISYKGWGNYYGRVVVKLTDVSQKALAEARINEIFLSHQSDSLAQVFLTSYADQYLYGNFETGVQAGGRIDYVYLTLVVALFILLIACINFVNLSTAFASLKSKEIGIKKSFGATKGVLSFQFFLEAIMLSAMAVFTAMILVFLFLAPFNQLTGKQLNPIADYQFLVGAVLFIPIIGMIAGVYPALYLSGLNTIAALKSRMSAYSLQGSLGRKTLVLVQFTLSIILIVCTLIVGEQMDYALHKDLGYDREHLIYFTKEGPLAENTAAFVSEAEQLTGVKQVSQSNFSVIPGYQNHTSGLSWVGKRDGDQISFWENSGDAESAAILGLQLVEGRLFDDELNAEGNSIIFNEAAIAAMGLSDPVGQTVQHYSGPKKIVGVVKDFYTQSLHMPLEPAMFMYSPQNAHCILVKIEAGHEQETLGKLEALYRKFNPNYPFYPKFVDQDYQALYESEMRVAKLSRLFSGLAILISCMGLFGLTIFQIQRKVKEIGIRKILGCKSWKLALQMTFDFTKSVFLALIIALPASYFLGAKWLENYADSITLEWWMFALAAVMAVVIAGITVGSQTLRAANANPANALRYE